MSIGSIELPRIGVEDDVTCPRNTLSLEIKLLFDVRFLGVHVLSSKSAEAMQRVPRNQTFVPALYADAYSLRSNFVVRQMSLIYGDCEWWSAPKDKPPLRL